MTGDVIERASCANCIRPIAYLLAVGWVHDELPCYAGETITCGVAAPAELRCTGCMTAQDRDSVGTIAPHRVDGRHCPGSGTQGAPLVGGDS